MEFKEIQEPLVAVLQHGNGMYRTAYQIFVNLRQETKDRLTQEYPVVPGRPLMGEGAGIYYSPASFIAHALAHSAKSNTRIKQECIDTRNVQFEGYPPGFKGTTSIWAWK